MLLICWECLDCSVFNSDLSSWTVSNVNNMRKMFDACSVFNSDLSVGM